MRKALIFGWIEVLIICLKSAVQKQKNELYRPKSISSSVRALPQNIYSIFYFLLSGFLDVALECVSLDPFSSLFPLLYTNCKWKK